MLKSDDMSLVDHLSELRKRIILVVLFFGVTMMGGFIAAGPLISYLRSRPPLSEVEWNALSPWDGVRIYMMVAFIIAITISLPFILYHVWSFMKPGLHPPERRAALRYIPGSVLFLVIGFSFAYFVVFPMAFYFTSFIAQRLELVETYGVMQYVSFMINILLPISLLFQMPIIVMFLTEIQMLNPQRLQKIRKAAYMLLVIISTIITPPDVISAILVALPLLLLYECSVLLAARVYRKQIAAKKVWEAVCKST